MRDAVVRKTRRHQKAHACCAGRNGRQQKYQKMPLRQADVLATYSIQGLQFSKYI